VRARLDVVLDRLAGAGCRLEVVDEAWPPEEASLNVSTTLMFAEAAAIHAAALAHDGRLYGADVRDRLRQGLAIPAVDYIKARASQQQLKDQVGALLRQVDCVVGPTVGVVPPRLEEAREPSLGGRLVAFTRLANVTGSPALSLPVPGPGLPVGLQLVAVDDEQALKFGAWVARVIAG
jgi:Asp-tRNA(Asn)/Glu-tRNA(Gln) amidotransferase A subunit family amidase